MIPPRWFRFWFSFWMAGALTMAACASKPIYDCGSWTPEDPKAKRAYCFPDCDSCGPAFRRPT